MKTPIKGASRLSFGQEALWYLNQMEPHSTAYHLGVCLRLTGSLDEQALVSVWSEIGAAHPQLRARFSLRRSRPSMLIDPTPPPLRIESGSTENLPRFWREIAERPFALENEAPVRALLLHDASGSSHLLLCLHHIAGDLWSAATLLRELSAGYAAHAAGRTPAVLRERMEYAEFTAAENRWLNGPQGLATWRFWQNYLDGINTEPLFMRSVADGKGSEFPVTLGLAESKLIQRAAQERKTTPYSVLLACYAHLLCEETGREELVIGTPATTRDRPALRNTVGYLVNPVPVRCSTAAGSGDIVSAIAANARRALKQRHFPFPVLVERLRVPRTFGAAPLFQTMFSYQSLPRNDRFFLPLTLNTGSARWQFGGGIVAETISMPPFDAQFPIALTLGRNESGFSGHLQVDGRCVTATDAARLARRFPELTVEVLAPRKQRQPTTMPDGRVERLEHLFDDAVRRTPDAIATSERGMDLTYAQVKTRAETFAAGLDAALPGCTGPVAVQMDSCAEAAIIILAILKSGRPFQPLDPGEPPARRNAALLSTGACALLSPRGIDPGNLPDNIMALSPQKLESVSSGVHRLPASSRTAYFVFTTGSTGEPKAVEVEHDAVVNHAKAMARIFGLTSQDRVLQFHTLAFDASFEEIFPSWTAGARIVFEPQVRRAGFPAFLETVEKCNITVLNLPTSYWHMLTREMVRSGLQPPSRLRLVAVGGEQASAEIYSAWGKLAPRCRWINTYGPTETTITALTYEPPADTSFQGGVPIGRPINCVTALLLNESGEQVLEGDGELFIGGAGLARGYSGDPAATAGKFTVRMIDGKANRFHRTGDRVKLRHDGNFEYLGRMDRQVKIRGYRVDPEEIERVLRAHPSVADAAVMPQEIKEEPILAAWIARADASLTKSTLRAYLSQNLPAHMIPSQLTFVARLPRKPSGKLDVAGLVHKRRHRKPRSKGDLQEMTALFSELLGHKVGPQDDFFLCGGHSLLAIKLLGRVETRYGVRLSVSDLLAAPNAKGIWTCMQSARPANPKVDDEPVPAETPVSAQQNRALLAHDISGPSPAKIVLLLRVNAQLDEGALIRAWESTARRHPLLRCGFLRTNAGIVLRETAELPSFERRILPARDFRTAVLELAKQEGSKSFDLDGRAPWIKLLLASSHESRDHHLILMAHHAIADGWALELLLNDLCSAYDNIREDRGVSSKSAPDYRTCALQQARWLKSAAAQTHISFWKKRLAGAEEPRLPFRRPSPQGTSWATERHEVALSSRQSHDFRRVAASCGTTTFALAMACFKALIHRYAGQNDITLGTVVSNRSTEAAQHVFGPLQNPALIRDEVTSNIPMRELARISAPTLAKGRTMELCHSSTSSVKLCQSARHPDWTVEFNSSRTIISCVDCDSEPHPLDLLSCRPKKAFSSWPSPCLPQPLAPRWCSNTSRQPTPRPASIVLRVSMSHCFRLWWLLRMRRSAN